jgi:hypothetical protein
MSEELCRHELMLGTCADCTPDGKLRRRPPASVDLDDGRTGRQSGGAALRVLSLFPARYEGRCIAVDSCWFQAGDLIGRVVGDNGYACEDHAVVHP